MRHDKDHDDDDCNDSHLVMATYTSNVRTKWSKCSKLDFQAHYIALKKRWCLDSKFKVYSHLME